MGPKSDEHRRRKAAGNPPPLVAPGKPRQATGKLARRIIAALKQRPGEAYTPNELALFCQAKKADMKKELCRLLLPDKKGRPGPVQKVGPGLYRAFLDKEQISQIENPSPKVHALQLVWHLGDSPLFGGSPPRSRAHARGGTSWTEFPSSKSEQLTRWHGSLRITLQLFPTKGTLMASVDSSQNPLGANEIQHLRTWLQATMQAEGFPWTEPRVATVEVNRDFQRFRLKGMEAARFYMGRLGFSQMDSMQLRHLEGALVQIYNKESLGVMRQEVRLQPSSLTMPELQGILESMFYGPLAPQASFLPLPPDDGGYT